MTNRYIVMLCGNITFDPGPQLDHPGVEVYQVDGPDAENKIAMGLLNDLVTPLNLAFIGGEDAKRYAEMYCGTWIEVGPSATEGVPQFFSQQCILDVNGS